jgi:uncharacterized protein with HEPN domain
MKRQKRAIHDYLEDILRYTEKAQRFVADVPSFDAFAEDEMRVMATIRALEVIGEAVKHIPHSLRRKYPEVPWQEIAWKTVQEDLAPLRQAILIPIAEPAFTKKQQLMIPSIPFPPARRNRPNRGFEKSLVCGINRS